MCYAYAIRCVKLCEMILFVYIEGNLLHFIIECKAGCSLVRCVLDLPICWGNEISQCAPSHTIVDQSERGIWNGKAFKIITSIDAVQKKTGYILLYIED